MENEKRYMNNAEFDDESLWTKLARFIKVSIYPIRRPFSKLKWHLRQRGWRIRFTWDDAMSEGSLEFPTAAWGWGDQLETAPEEVMNDIVDQELIPWLHEEITRAPAPLGFDNQGIRIQINIDGKLVEKHERVVDKYGWRKEGRAETTAWLRDKMLQYREDNGEVEISVIGIGKVMAAYDMVSPYGMPRKSENG
jgi:hypothetical protein